MPKLIGQRVEEMEGFFLFPPFFHYHSKHETCEHEISETQSIPFEKIS